MLMIYRRHLKNCEHRGEGRKYRRCKCPLWADGFLDGVELRKALGLRDWTKAQELVRKWEGDGEPKTTDGPGTAEPISLEEAWRIFLADQEARKLHASTVRKYKLLRRKMQEFATERGLRFLSEMDLSILTEFRAGWHDGALSSLKKLDRFTNILSVWGRTQLDKRKPGSEVKSAKGLDAANIAILHGRNATNFRGIRPVC